MSVQRVFFWRSSASRIARSIHWLIVRSSAFAAAATASLRSGRRRTPTRSDRCTSTFDLVRRFVVDTLSPSVHNMFDTVAQGRTVKDMGP